MTFTGINVTCQVLEFGVPIPYEFINNEPVMKQLRGLFRYNPDMPGAIELVNPNKFLPSKLRQFAYIILPL
jgi:hypothetical protein